MSRQTSLHGKGREAIHIMVAYTYTPICCTTKNFISLHELSPKKMKLKSHAAIQWYTIRVCACMNWSPYALYSQRICALHGLLELHTTNMFFSSGFSILQQYSFGVNICRFCKCKDIVEGREDVSFVLR